MTCYRLYLQPNKPISLVNLLKSYIYVFFHCVHIIPTIKKKTIFVATVSLRSLQLFHYQRMIYFQDLSKIHLGPEDLPVFDSETIVDF